ncbi:MAG: hypothetical protein ACI9VN_003830, partial [Patescibacteria group bacterium]
SEAEIAVNSPSPASLFSDFILLLNDFCCHFLAVAQRLVY